MFGEPNYLEGMFGNMPEESPAVPLKAAESAPGRRPDPVQPPPSVQKEQITSNAHELYLKSQINEAQSMADLDLIRKWNAYLQHSFAILDLVEEEEEMGKNGFPSPEMKDKVIGAIQRELAKAQNALVDTEESFKSIKASPQTIKASQIVAEALFIKDHPDHAKIEGKLKNVMSYNRFVLSGDQSPPPQQHHQAMPQAQQSRQPDHQYAPPSPQHIAPDPQALQILRQQGLHKGSAVKGLFEDPLGWLTGSTPGRIISLGALIGGGVYTYNHFIKSDIDEE